MFSQNVVINFFYSAVYKHFSSYNCKSPFLSLISGFCFYDSTILSKFVIILENSFWETWVPSDKF
jgi:hypothetical protein